MGKLKNYINNYKNIYQYIAIITAFMVVCQAFKPVLYFL